MKTSRIPSLISVFISLLCNAEWTESQNPYLHNIFIEPENSMVHSGEPFQFVCMANVSIVQCTINMPQNRRLFSISTTDHQESQYFGRGLQAGDCGARIMHANPAIHTGIFSCDILIQLDNVAYRATNSTHLVVIANENEVPVIRMERQEYVEGNLLTAKCRIRNTKPAANLSWILDDDNIIATETEMPKRSQTIVEETFLKRERYKELILKRALKWNDHGRKLRCIAQHFNGDHKHTSDELEIHVQFAPRPLKNPVVIARDLDHETLLIEYILRANPKPTVQWNVNNMAISEMNLEYNDEVTNLQLPGMWQARLEVKRPGRDLANNISMTASNLLGSQTYNFRIVEQKPDAITDSIISEKLTYECEGQAITVVIILSILLFLTIVGFTTVLVIFKRKFKRKEIDLLHRLQVAHRRMQLDQPQQGAEAVQPQVEEYSYISVLHQDDRRLTPLDHQGHESMIYQNTQDNTSEARTAYMQSTPSYINHPRAVSYVNQM